MRALPLFVSAVLAQTSAQAADLSRTPNLTLDGAREVIAAAVAHARASQAPGGAIAVVDAAGTLVSLERLDGTFPAAREHLHRQGAHRCAVPQADPRIRGTRQRADA